MYPRLIKEREIIKKQRRKGRNEEEKKIENLKKRVREEKGIKSYIVC